MADDILNEGSEEEKNSNQSDEDFGLPDLEFDDLQELDFNLDDDVEEEAVAEETSLPEPEGIDMSVLDDIELPDSAEGLQPGDLDPPESSVLDQGIEEVEDVLDSAQLISDRLGDDDDDDSLVPDFSSEINYDDLIGESIADPEPDLGTEDFASIEDIGLDLSPEESTDTDDLLANIDSPDQLAALGILDEDEASGSDEAVAEAPGPDTGSSLFSADDETESIFGTDSMSLQGEDSPKFEGQDTPTLPPNYKPYSYEESSGGFGKVILIGVVIISILGGAFYYFSLDSEPKEIAKKEVRKKTVKKTTPRATSTPTEKSETTSDKASNSASTDAKKPVAKTPAKKTPAKIVEKPVEKQKPVAVSAPTGEIVRITSKTSRSYVIIASFVDEDLAMDLATDLSGDGMGVKIIHPYGRSKRYRVSVADYSSYGDAASQLGTFKADYGDEVWALKY